MSYVLWVIAASLATVAAIVFDILYYRYWGRLSKRMQEARAAGNIGEYWRLDSEMTFVSVVGTVFFLIANATPTLLWLAVGNASYLP